MIIIKANARLHISLLSMHKGGYRLNGGIGFAVDHPDLSCQFEVSSRFYATDNRQHPLTRVELENLETIIQKEKERRHLPNNITALIGGNAPSHYGFGTATAIRLACLEALYLINGIEPEPEALIMASDRGGTSGIGIRTYFSGGCVFDLGKRAAVQSFAPSDSGRGDVAQPLLLKNVETPAWEVGICIPNNIAAKTLEEEISFFNETCPTAPESSYETLYHALFGLFAGILENDKMAFEDALNRLQECEWKKAERQQYGASLEALEKIIRECGASSVGMSSLGPSLFFFADDIPTVMAALKAKGLNNNIFSGRMANSGRQINHA